MGPMELPYVLELYVHVKEKKPAGIHIIWLLVKLCIRGDISKHTVIIGLHVACVYVHLKKSRERRSQEKEETCPRVCSTDLERPGAFLFVLNLGKAMASTALARAWERLFVYGYGSVLRREILLQHDILIIFGQAIQGKLLDSGCRRDEDAGQWRYAVAHAYIHTTRLLWRKFLGLAGQGKSKMKRGRKISGYLLQQHAGSDKEGI